MESNKLIKEIKLENENLAAHLNRISKSGFKLHSIDVDVMLDKTKLLYEQLLHLQELVSDTKPDNMIKTTDHVPDTGTPATNVEERSFTAPTTMPAPDPENKDEADMADRQPEDHPAPTEFQEETEQENIEKHAVDENEPKTYNETGDQPSVAVEDHSMNEKKNFESTSVEQPADAQQKKEHAPKIALDLFAEEAPTSLGDKYAPDHDPSIAARMQKSPISDLRSAIGINDKFLLINELFKGNLSQYNKTIDELNDFQSINGAFTFLIETKVQYQWEEDSQAFKRLKELVERKFS